MMTITRFRSVDVNVSTFSNFFFTTLLPAFFAKGWRVRGSGDGTTYENEGQKTVGASFARLVTPGPGSLVDGETFTLDDGVNTPTVFEFDTVPNGVGGGNVAVDISAAVDEGDVRDAIIAAVNGVGAGLAISAEPTFTCDGDPGGVAVVHLKNDAGGVAGNTTSSETVTNGNFTLEDMHGGTASGGAGSEGVYHVLTTASGIDTTSPWVAGNWGNNGGFGIPGPDFRGASWIRIASPVDADHYVEYLFQLPVSGGGIEGAHTIVMCRGAQRFDKGGDEWQRPATGFDTQVGVTLGEVETGEQPSIIDQITFFDASNGSRLHGFIGDKSVDYDFSLLFQRKTTNQVFGWWGRLRTIMDAPRSDGTPDPDPYVHIGLLENASGNSSHQVTGNDAISISGSGTVTSVNSERLEDRTVVFSGSGRKVFATYGIDDPVVPAGVQGHYVVAFMAPSVGNNDSLAYDNGFEDLYTGLVIVDPIVKVGRYWDDANTALLRFWKGIVKNSREFSWCARGNPSRPFILKDGVNPQRVHWGRFVFVWDDDPGGTDEILDQL